MEHLGIEDTITITKKTEIKVSELLKDKKRLFEYIKKGFSFDDEVLKIAGIKKTISNEKITNVFVEHEKEKHKELPKETESLKNILKSLHTIDNQTEENTPLNEVEEDDEQ